MLKKQTLLRASTDQHSRLHLAAEKVLPRTNSICKKDPKNYKYCLGFQTALQL